MRLHKVFLLVVIVLVGFTAQSQTIIPGGYVSGTWDEAGSPYLVQGSIKVHEDSSLQIFAGVEVILGGYALFDVYGLISAIGTMNDSIVFSSDYPGWMGMRIMTANVPAGDSIRLSYCLFTQGSNNQSNGVGGALYISNTDRVAINNCEFRANYAKDAAGAFYISNSNLLCMNSKFTGNHCGNTGSGKGGAVYVVNASPLFFNCNFQSNFADICGAIYSNNSSPILNQCNFLWNSSSGGGGAVVFHESGQPIIKDCLFENNHANGSGGAIAFLEGIICTLEDCRFIDNTSNSDIYLADGGAVLITPYDNEVNFLNCEFSLNYAEDFGGALYITSPSNIIGCLFQENSMPSLQDSRGGAITIGECSVRIVNSTFANNYALYGSSIYSEDAELYMLNNILWDEGSSAEPRIFLSTNVNPPLLFVDHNNLQGGQGIISGTGAYMVHWGEGNIDIDPHFLSPGDDFSLAWNSPCINAGSTDTLQLLIPAEDLAGNPRIMGGEIDMGCYEYQNSLIIGELSEEQEFLVYPNPAREYINIENTSGTDFKGKLYLSDLSGKRACERTVNIQNYSSFRISVSSLPEGMYILNLASENSFEAFKIIIQ